MPVISTPFPWTRRSFLSAAAAAAGVTGLTPTAHATPAPFQPTWDSLVEGYRTPDWFRDAKFGIWAQLPECLAGAPAAAIKIRGAAV